MVKCAHLAPLSRVQQPQPHFVRGPRGCPMRLNVGSYRNFLTRTELRHTITAERQNRVVGLLKVNVLAAAQTDGHVSGASRTARVIEPPFATFVRGFLQLSHFKARFERKPAFLSRWRAPGSIAGELRTVWCGDSARPSAGPNGNPHLTSRRPALGVHGLLAVWGLTPS
jgi:hypothetical protein